ncbi:glycosyltransferase [Kocuria sp. M1N1S27]|uniref:glycosyltransferase n=1 Tax=Kocuria kalidii TaxID=3376283 RepID=UPI0037AB5C4C
MNRSLVRLLVLLTVLLGVNYLAWRWLESLNWSAWWIAVPLVLAETYSLVHVALFGLTVWRPRLRGEAGDPPAGATVDVLVSTSDEPLDQVLRTALAAQAIRYPHRTWILDDGARPELGALAAGHGLGYLARGEDRTGRPQPAGARGLDHALTATEGEFLLLLDADQVPDPEILDRTLGWFGDREVALVQTPLWFAGVPDHDPLGSQDPLFHGPVQQGKDGWDAALFCGTNAILRREALLQLGRSGHLEETERDVKASLARTRAALRRARRSPEAANPVVSGMLDDVEAATERARTELRAGAPLAELTHRLQREVDAAARRTVTRDFSQIEADLASIAALELPPEDGMVWPDELAAAVDRMSRRDLSPLAAVEPVRRVLEAVSADRPGEARPVVPHATIPVAEDMALTTRLHGLGRRSVYHHEILVRGVAPEELGTVLARRRHRARATVQVLLRENPLLQRRLGWGQRLMHFATMWSCLGGFAAVVYFAAPIVYLVLGVLPVTSLDGDFFARFVPFVVVHQLLVLVVGRGIPTWRTRQYRLALFPVWIGACTTAARTVWSGRHPGLAVGPGVRQDAGPAWHLVRPQLAVMGMLAAALVVGALRLAVGLNEPVGTLVNVAWAAFDLVVLSVLVTAVRYPGPDPEKRSADAVHG